MATDGTSELRQGTALRYAAFAREWVRNGGNGTEAAIAVGYAPRSAHATATEVLKHPYTQQVISETQAEASRVTGASIAETVQQLRQILLVDPKEALNADGAFKPIHEWPVELRQSLAAIKQEELYGEVMGEDQNGKPKMQKVVVGRVVTVKWWGKTEAAKQLMQHLGGFKPTEHKHTFTFADLVNASHQVDGASGPVAESMVEATEEAH